MKKYYKYILLSFVACGFGQCLDEIKLKIKDTQSNVVVDGQITDSLADHVIRLHKSSVIGVGNDNIQEPIGGAEVIVSDDASNKYLFTEGKAGIYQKQFKCEPGRIYTLQVKLKDGQLIISAPQKLSAAPLIGQINTEVKDVTYINTAGNVSIDKRLILYVNTDLRQHNEDLYLRWRAEGEYEFKENYPGALSTKLCYVKNNVDLNNLKLFDSRTINDKMIRDEPFINTALDYRFAGQYCFHIQQLAMTLEEYNYWSSVKSVTEISGNLFDSPPGTVQGNLYNETNPEQKVVGYFSVNGVKSVRFFANPQSLNQVDIAPKCRPRFNSSPTPDCINCLSIDESTLIKPPYWQP